VIPDEEDVQIFLGPGQFRTSFYVAQDNLEPIANRDDAQLSHRHISFFFQGYDREQGRYKAGPRLKFCFPSPNDEKAIASLSK
jgi:hypothetical protein